MSTLISTITAPITPRAVLFDWDNTLVDSWDTIYEALHHTFIIMGHEPWSKEDVRAGRDNIHHSLRESFPRIFGDKWEEARDHYRQHFLAIHLGRLTAFDDAVHTLEALSKQSIYMAIVSNKTGKFLREEVTQLGWDHYFERIIGAGDADEDKPSIAPVTLALESSDIAPHECWFVGDSHTDMECAANAGCQAIAFNASGLLSKYDAAMHSFSDHKTFAAHINQWNNI